jgi:deoxyribose-phosphate aldolase
MDSSVFRYLDHSLLSPAAKHDELEAAAAVALRLDVAALCILPYFVARARQLLSSSSVKTCTVVSFPHGSLGTAAKLRETAGALEDGAEEVDVVVNLSHVASQDFSAIDREIGAINDLVHRAGARIKWILETAAHDDATIVRLCQLASSHGSDWVKTSTGFGPGGATPAHVALLRASCPTTVQVKASGGIRSLAEVERYVALGASRIGTSRSEEMADELRRRARG